MRSVIVAVRATPLIEQYHPTQRILRFTPSEQIIKVILSKRTGATPSTNSSIDRAPRRKIVYG